MQSFGHPFEIGYSLHFGRELALPPHQGKAVNLALGSPLKHRRRRHDRAQYRIVASLERFHDHRALFHRRQIEACALRWREIDETASCLRLETTKTGRSTRPIGKAALQLLEALPRGPSEWVFPNRDGSGSADLKKSMADLFDAAGMADARSHDLRRTFGSLAADEGS